MAMFDQTQAGNILNAILHNNSFTTPATVHTLLGTSAPTATANMTELGGGTGYTTGGTVMTFNSASAAATSNSSSASWTNGSGGTWSIVGLEIWNSGLTARYLFGSWTGQPVSIANGNNFQVAAAGIAISLVLCKVFPFAIRSNGAALTCMNGGSHRIKAVPLK